MPGGATLAEDSIVHLDVETDDQVASSTERRGAKLPTRPEYQLEQRLVFVRIRDAKMNRVLTFRH